MAASRVWTAGARHLSHRSIVVHSFIASLAPSLGLRVPPALSRCTIASSARRLQLDRASDATNGVSAGSRDDTVPAQDPWYLETEEQQELNRPAENPFAERQRIPDLPSNAPPILADLLKHISIDIGLDYLSIVDLRALDPPPALGSNLLMIFGTARSERHLNVAADRLCRWLRSTYKLRPFADGLLGRNELKLKLKRKARRSRMLGAAGAVDVGNFDDGINTGWICVNIGSVPGHAEHDQDRPLESERDADADEDTSIEGFVGFGVSSHDPKIVVQMLTEEKRGELDLESLWVKAAARAEAKAKAKAENADSPPPKDEEDVEVDPQQARAALERQSSPGLAPVSAGHEQRRYYHAGPGMLSKTSPSRPQIALERYAIKLKTTPAPGPNEAHRQMQELLVELFRMEPAKALKSLGTGQDDVRSTGFLRRFYASMPVFLTAQHWSHLVALHGYAVELGHHGYTKLGLVRKSQSMQADVDVMPEETLLYVLRTVLQAPHQVSPKDRAFRHELVTRNAEGALRQNIGLAIEVLQTMEHLGYDTTSDAIFGMLHEAFVAPQFYPVGQSVLQGKAHPKPMKNKQLRFAHADQLSLAAPAHARFHTQLLAALLHIRPLPVSHALYEQMMAAYAAQARWGPFWQLWHAVAQGMAPRSPRMYYLVFHHLAAQRNIQSLRDNLRKWVPVMALEEPPVEVEGELAVAIQRALEVAELADSVDPFFVELKGRADEGAREAVMRDWKEGRIGGRGVDLDMEREVALARASEEVDARWAR